MVEGIKGGEADNKEAYLGTSYYLWRGGEGFKGGSHCFQGGREGGSVVADRVKSGIEN